MLAEHLEGWAAGVSNLRIRRREPLSQVATGCNAVSFRPLAYEDSRLWLKCLGSRNNEYLIYYVVLFCRAVEV